MLNCKKEIYKIIRYMFVSRGFAETFQFSVPVKTDKFVIAKISRDNLPNILDFSQLIIFSSLTRIRLQFSVLPGKAADLLLDP